MEKQSINETYLLVNEFDPNDHEELEAKTYQEALEEALLKLGHRISIIDEYP